MSGRDRRDVVEQRLGLGCARLGSVLARDQSDSSQLIQTAFDRGIRFFDTANIYGQGDSERILGTALKDHRKQITIVTKAGQYFPAWMRLAKPVKRVITPLIRRSSVGRDMTSKVREAALPQDFSERSLRTSIEGSLRRLNTDYADIVLLHSPPSHVIANGEAFSALERIRAAGKAIKIGISCEDVGSALLALDDRRVEAIELPLWPVTEDTERFLDRVRCRAIFIIGRGVMAIGSKTPGVDRWSRARAALVAALSRPEINRVLIGTTRISHLGQVLDTVQNIEAPPCS
jgi:aryl-alcohol dehydrogenase-like predicted oxidoreductase